MAVAKFSRRELAWTGARQEIASRCHKRFTSRLCWAAWLQRALFKPPALGPDVPDRAFQMVLARDIRADAVTVTWAFDRINHY
jgi:hypothetical protein